MMKILIVIAVFLMSTLSYGQVVQPSPPDSLILRSGEIAEVEIVDREKGDIKYYKLGDDENLRRTPVRMFKEIIEHSFADQPFGRDDKGTIMYSEVVQAEGLTADNLFTLSKIYLADKYGDLDKVIELEDKDLGMILVEGLFTIWIEHSGYPYEYKVWHSLKIEMKEGRYRYQLYNFNIQYKIEDRERAENMFSDESNLHPVHVKIKDKMLQRIQTFANDIKTNLVPKSKDDKW